MRIEFESLNIFKKMEKEFFENKKNPSVSDIEKLLQSIKTELVTGSYSPLLEASFIACENLFSTKLFKQLVFYPKNYHIFEMNCRINSSNYFSWRLPKLLLDYMNDNSNNIETALKYIFGIWNPPSPDPKHLIQVYKEIDILIFEIRQKMYLRIQKEDCKVKSLLVEAEEEKNKIIELAHIQANSEAQEIVESARREIDAEKQSIIGDAQQKADKIIQNANILAESKLEEAKRRILEVSINTHLSECEMEQERISQCFSAVRDALDKANESFRQLENSVFENNTKKAYNQLIELYNLIADTRDSTFIIASEKENQDLQNAAYNMNEFLNMLADYLADYGIKIITSDKGDKFNPKYHDCKNASDQFDPRNAYISCSIRSGFVWGEKVLQKEIVKIEGDNYVPWN